MKPNIEVIASYKFFRHPIKWLKEYRARKILEKVIEYRWDNGLSDKIHALVFHKNAYGHTPLIKSDSKILVCSICDKEI